MRRVIQTGLMLAVPMLMLGAIGCDFSCFATATCEPFEYVDLVSGGPGDDDEVGEIDGLGGLGGLYCPDDPATGSIAESCGVFVAPSGDDGNVGSRAKPVRTIAHAIELAKMEGGRLRVYACGGVYPEAVSLADVSLFGGFDCANDWIYVGSEMLAEINAPPGLAAMILKESKLTSLIVDVRVTASDAVEPGASSIAVLALPDSKAFFRRVELIAGEGAKGADGKDGSPDGLPAMDGSPGKNGADACTMDNGIGGVGASTQCTDGSDSFGGAGGDGNAIIATDGLNGQQAPDPNPLGYGAGGQAENALKMTLCTGGQQGAHGQSGSDGDGGYGFGHLTPEGMFGVWGSDGKPGFPGQGGGGGGASLGNALCGAAPHGGAGGGSGGAGGCGGMGGKGGQPGGSSIGLALLSSGLDADGIKIIAKRGGEGGRGGAMQPGGKGGLPGYGGFGFGGPNGAQAACEGGVGGKGGDGGHGGGGLGGHSFSVAKIPSAAWWPTEYEFIAELPVDGGKGGNPGSNDGWPGGSATSITIDP